MKIIYLLFLFLYFVNTLEAQTEFPKLNASWCYQARGDNNEFLYDACYSPDSLVFINGLEYSRIRLQKTFNDTFSTVYYREENSKFFILPQDSTQEILLCDFNLKLDDTFETGTWGWFQTENATLVVYDIGTIITNDNVSRKIISLRSNEGKDYFANWIEGIGNINWIFLYPNYLGSISGNISLICHSVNNESVFPNISEAECKAINSVTYWEGHKQIKLYPSPTSGQFSIQNVDNISKIQIYNLFGNKTNIGVYNNQIDISNYPSGVYYMVVTDTFNNNHFGKIIKY